VIPCVRRTQRPSRERGPAFGASRMAVTNMGMVSIVCPQTRQIVPTGFVMTAAEFAAAVLGRNDLRCPACGRIHSWGKADAQLVEQTPGK